MESGRTSSLSAGTVAVEKRQAGVTLAWPLILWFLVLLVILFFPVLKVMVKEWGTLEEMGHAFFVPPVVAYIVWDDRKRIMATPRKTCWPALILVVWGFCQMLIGFLGADFFLARTAFLISLVGLIWTLAGTAMVRTLAFPLVVLLFMIRIPLFVYQQITFPLQIFASTAAAKFLGAIGVPVLRDGNVLELPSQRLEVVEACSGIRSLVSLGFISLIYAHLFDRRVWMRWALFIATIPIAIFANATRVAITGIVSEYKKEWAEGFYHSFEGWVIFMVALVCLMVTHRLISRFARASHA
jgi:exosortase